MMLKNYGIFNLLFERLSLFTITFDPIKECIKYIKRGYIYKNILLVNQAVSDKEINLNINIPIEGNEKIFGKSSIANQFDFQKQEVFRPLLRSIFEHIKTKYHKLYKD